MLLGIAMEFNEKAGTLNVENIPEGSDESRCLQLQLDAIDDDWYNWECIFEDVEDKDVPDGVVMIRGMYCVEEVCGEVVSAKRKCLSYIIFNANIYFRRCINSMQ